MIFAKVLFLKKIIFERKYNNFRKMSETDSSPDVVDQHSSANQLPNEKNSHQAEGDFQSSLKRRWNKLIEKVKEYEIMSEFDFFCVQTRMNINGEDSFKTMFGGGFYLSILILTLFFTLTFSNLNLQSSITSLNFLQKSSDPKAHIFTQGTSYTSFYIYHNLLKSKVNISSLLGTVIEKIQFYVVINNKAYILQTTVCNNGQDICLDQSDKNSIQAKIWKDGNSKSHIQLEIQLAEGQSIFSFIFYQGRFVSHNYRQTTNGVNHYTQLGNVITFLQTYEFSVDYVKYNTNNVVFGHLANIGSKRIQFYKINPQPSFVNTFYQTFTQTNHSAPNFKVVWQYSGNMHHSDQNFDDVTEPILFFLSVSQTIYVLCYFFFLKNYTSNSLYLYISDSLYFIKNERTGRHYNFKNGFAPFFACMIHNHFITILINRALKGRDMQVQSYFGSNMQRCFEMINRGQKSLGQEEFFGSFSKISGQQNFQPQKILIDFDAIQKEEQKKQDERSEEFAEKELQQKINESFAQQERSICIEAFKNMCQDHEFNSLERKKHLLEVLQTKNRNSKLIGKAQIQFEDYKRHVEMNKKKTLKQDNLLHVDVQINHNELNEVEVNEVISENSQQSQQESIRQIIRQR